MLQAALPHRGVTLQHRSRCPSATVTIPHKVASISQRIHILIHSHAFGGMDANGTAPAKMMTSYHQQISGDKEIPNEL